MQYGHEIPAGTMVAFSSGCYSDYRVNGFTKLLKPLNETAWNEMVKAATVVPSYNPQGDPRFEEDKALTWLYENGYAENVEYVELHMGDYGDAPEWKNA